MAIDWQTRVDDLAALTLTGADDTNRDSMIARLSAAGVLYDNVRAAVGTSDIEAERAAADGAFTTAVTTWVATAQPVHERADSMTRFILGTGSPIVFASDGSAEDELVGRLSDAQKKVTSPSDPSFALADELGAHAGAVAHAYAARPKAPTYGPLLMTPRVGFGVDSAIGFPRVSIRSYEVKVLQPLVDEADILLAELAFS